MPGVKACRSTENFYFQQSHCHLRPTVQGYPANICIDLTLSQTRVTGYLITLIVQVGFVVGLKKCTNCEKNGWLNLYCVAMIQVNPFRNSGKRWFGKTRHKM